MPTPVYRADGVAARVPYTPTYVLEDVLGSRGPVSQRFVLPSAATSLWPSVKSSDVAVLEAGTNRVTMMSPTGQLKRTLAAPLDTQGGRGASSRPLRHPAGIASYENDLIIADTHNHRLLRMRLDDGRPLSNTTKGQMHFGSGTSDLRYPRGLATIQHAWPPHGTLPLLYVADSGNHRVCVFAIAPPSPHILALPGPTPTVTSNTMTPLISFGGPGNGASNMDTPSAIAVGHMHVEGKLEPRLFVADTNHDRVMEWRFFEDTTRYDHIRNIGQAGSLPGYFHKPSGVALLLSPDRFRERSRLFVAEGTGGRTQVFSASGRHMQVLTPPLAGRLGGICIASRPSIDEAFEDHRVMVVGRERNSLFVYRREVKQPPRFEHPKG